MTAVSRRVLLAGLATLSISHMPGTSNAQPEDSAEVKRWMDEWFRLEESRPIVGPLHLGRFVEPIYFLRKPTIWLPDSTQASRFKPVTVPVGFVTDFASIPKAFWMILRPDGNYTHPAIVHDFLYWTQTTTRETADEIFRILMEDFRISSFEAVPIYNAVKLGGARAWEENTKARAGGEKRILKLFPEDPLTTWEDWKKRPEVFE
jgi:hypothetical protein